MKGLRILREKHKLTQLELAKKIGVRQGAVMNWESGLRFPKKANLIALLRIFNCTIDELL